MKQYDEETVKMLNLLEFARKRMVIHHERERVMTFFLELYARGNREITKTGMRELAKLLEYIFDFRRLNNPERSLGSQTIETELYKLRERMEEEEP